SYFKQWVHGRIAWPVDEPGAWHLPIDATDEYCAHIIAESRIVKANGKVIWVRDGKKPNHWLDCEALNAAAGHMGNVHLMRPSKSLNATAAPSPDGEPTADVKRPVDPLLRRPRRPNWTTGWR